MFRLSTYAEDLTGHARRRYEEKLTLIGNVDPFLLHGEPALAAHTNLPPVEASDIVAYLVLQTSFLSTKQFKAYKSLHGGLQSVHQWLGEGCAGLDYGRQSCCYRKG